MPHPGARGGASPSQGYGGFDDTWDAYEVNDASRVSPVVSLTVSHRGRKIRHVTMLGASQRNRHIVFFFDS